MRKPLVILGITMLLGVAVMPCASATQQTQRFANYLEKCGFNVTLEDGYWCADYLDEATGATTWIVFPDSVAITQVDILFCGYNPDLSRREVFDAFRISVIDAITGAFPKELNEAVVKAIMFDIPELQLVTGESAQAQVGEFSLDGGFFFSDDGYLTFMLTIEAIRD